MNKQNYKFLPIFVFAVLLPAMILVYFGLRGVRNERYFREYKSKQIINTKVENLQNFLGEQLEKIELELQSTGKASGRLIEKSFILTSDAVPIFPIPLKSKDNFYGSSGEDIKIECSVFLEKYNKILRKNPFSVFRLLNKNRIDDDLKALIIPELIRLLSQDRNFKKAIRLTNIFSKQRYNIVSPIVLNNMISGPLLLADLLTLSTNKNVQNPGVMLLDYLTNDTATVFLEDFIYYSKKAIPLLSMNLQSRYKKQLKKREYIDSFLKEISAGIKKKDFSNGYYYNKNDLFYLSTISSGNITGFIVNQMELKNSISIWLKENAQIKIKVENPNGISLIKNYTSIEKENAGSLPLIQPLGSRLPFLILTIWDIGNKEMSEVLKKHQYLYGSVLVFLVLALLIGIFLSYYLIKKELALISLRTNFMSAVSHELKTPLTSIKMFGELLMSGLIKDTKKQMDYYTMIVAESERLTGMINNVLDFSSLEKKTSNFVFVVSDPEHIIDEVLDSMSLILDKNDVEIIRKKSKNKVNIVCDIRSFKQIISNLIDNAVKYSKEKKEITIETKLVDSYLHLLIKDRGIGIPKGKEKSIFNEFYRVGSEMTREVKGTGLGLAIVSGIARAHKWKIEAKSRTNGGSILMLTMNIHKEGDLN